MLVAEMLRTVSTGGPRNAGKGGGDILSSSAVDSDGPLFSDAGMDGGESREDSIPHAGSSGPGSRLPWHRNGGSDGDEELASEDAAVLQAQSAGMRDTKAWDDDFLSPRVMSLWRKHVEQHARRRDAKIGELSKDLLRAAWAYDTGQVVRLLQAARKEQQLAPGAPLWVNLPGGAGRADATTITTGELMEALLTDGCMLERDASGRARPLRDVPHAMRCACPRAPRTPCTPCPPPPPLPY